MKNLIEKLGGLLTSIFVLGIFALLFWPVSYAVTSLSEGLRTVVLIACALFAIVVSYIAGFGKAKSTSAPSNTSARISSGGSKTLEIKHKMILLCAIVVAIWLFLHFYLLNM